MATVFSWVDSSVHGGVPVNAVKGGKDTDGSEIYVGRAFYEHDLLPAKIIPRRAEAFVSYGGKEIAVFQFQLLCGINFHWIVHTVGNRIPESAIEGGKTKAGETLFIGRVVHNGSLTIGKVHHSHKCCYIGYGGKEIKYNKCELLAKRF